VTSEAVRDARAGLDQLRARNDPVDITAALLRLGRALLAAGQATEAADAFEQAAAAAADTDVVLQAEALGNAGVARYHAGQLPEALVRSQEAIELFERLGDRLAAARTEANVAVVHRDLGEWERAATAAEQADARWDAGIDRPGEHSSAVAIPALLGERPGSWRRDDLGPALERDAALLAGRHGPARALPAWFAAFGHYRARSDEAGLYRATLQLAVTYQQLGRWPDALRALTDAHRMAARSEDPGQLALLHAGLAATHVALGRFDTATPHALAAVAAYRQVDDLAGLGRALVTEGQCLAAAGDRVGAATSWDEARRLLAGRDAAGSAALERVLAGD